MALLKSISNYLDQAKIKYEVLDHKTVYTAFDKAGTLHQPAKAVVKTAVLKLDQKDYALALIPADKLLDLKKIGQVINAQRKKAGLKIFKKISFADEKWMKKNIASQVGATPPFGSLYNLPTLVDNILLKQPKIYVNGGNYNTSIKLSQAAFSKSLADFLKGSFGMAKPKKKKATKKKPAKTVKKKAKKKK